MNTRRSTRAPATGGILQSRMNEECTRVEAGAGKEEKWYSEWYECDMNTRRSWRVHTAVGEITQAPSAGGTCKLE